MGRRLPATPFEQFCTRLARTCLGHVRTEPSNAASAQAPQAWLEPVRHEDVAHARALCQEYRVALRLKGDPRSTACAQATLWVSPQTEGATFSLVDAQAGLWKADAGCTLAQLTETEVFAGMALTPELTLAQWFAWPEAPRAAMPGVALGDEDHTLGQAGSCEPGSVMLQALRRVERAEILLADGTLEVLGPFGATAQAPLRSLTMQRLVPKLFELAGSEAAQHCAQMTPWPARYRLDALMTTAAHEPNLAQLFYGHQGRLGWVQTLWLRRLGAAPHTQPIGQKAMQDGGQEIEQDRPSKYTFEVKIAVQAEHAHARQSKLVAQLDHELKHILDPNGRFGSNPDVSTSSTHSDASV
jgi:hypothetical protein